jgi:hypothetical protein
MFKKKFLTVLIAFFAIFLFPSFAFAQLDSTVEDTTVDWDTEWEDWEDWDYDYDYEYGIEDAGLAAGTFAAIMAAVLLPAIVIGIGSYVYMGITLSKIGKKLNYEKTWFAWVPILNFVMMLQLADLSPWLILLGLVPIVNGIAMLVLSVITMMNICEKLGKDKLLGLLVLVPIGNLVLLGILAWGKDDGEVKSVEKKEEVNVVQEEEKVEDIEE